MSLERPSDVAICLGFFDAERGTAVVVGGAVRMDEIFATIAIVLLEDTVQFCSGFVHGVSIIDDPPAFAQEAAALDALRVYREWMLTQDQSLFRYVEIRVRSAGVTYKLKEWMRVGRCTLVSPAASGLIAGIQGLPSWLSVDIF